MLEPIDVEEILSKSLTTILDALNNHINRDQYKVVDNILNEVRKKIRRLVIKGENNETD